jgi:predicted branched-subunit amino acid permease
MGERLPEGVRVSLPVVVPTFVLGSVYGLLAAPVMGGFAAVVMGFLVFAGGAQFAALGVLSVGGTAVAAALAGALTNLRFLPIGFAIAPALKGGRLRRSAEGQAVTDASFVLASRGDGRYDRSLLLWSTATQGVFWHAGTLLGVLASDLVPDPETWGLDVILPAFFLSLLATELRRHHRSAVVVALLAAGIAVLAVPVLPTGLPIAVAALACLLALRRPA